MQTSIKLVSGNIQSYGWDINFPMEKTETCLPSSQAGNSRKNSLCSLWEISIPGEIDVTFL